MLLLKWSSWAFIPEKSLKLPQKPVHECSEQLYLKQHQIRNTQGGPQKVINKPWVHPHHWILLSNKKNTFLIHVTTQMNSQKVNVNGKKPTPLYNILKWQNCRDGKEISGCQGLEMEWRQERRGCGYKRATCTDGNILLFSNNVSNRLWYQTTVLHQLPGRRNSVKGTWDLGSVCYFL